jgi:N,N'-diacetyllegionaminate synthase
LIKFGSFKEPCRDDQFSGNITQRGIVMPTKLQQILNGKKEPYLIAETAYAHAGSYDYLCGQVDAVDFRYVDALKFHLLLDIDGYMRKDHPQFETIKQWLFDREQWAEILGRTKRRSIDVIALADDEASLIWLQTEASLIDAVEIHSTGLHDLHLLKLAGQLGKPVFLGIGGSTPDEISMTLAALEGVPVVLMYGYQSYPTDYRKLNMRLLPKLCGLFEAITGYADHTAYDDPENELVSVMGYILGAPIIEKHFVLEKGTPRPDYESAVSPADLRSIKNKLELASDCLGQGPPSFSAAEQAYRQPGLMKKAPLARTALRKGARLQLDDVIFKRTGSASYTRQTDIYTLLGMEISRDISPDEALDFSNLR